jgi:hypothetical protein
MERTRRHENSPLLHPRAAEALTLASRPLGEEPVESVRVVAFVLDDGTVRTLDREPASPQAWSSGHLSGSDWTLWWERRSLAGA